MRKPNLSSHFLLVLVLVALLATGLVLTAFGQSGGKTEEGQNRWWGFFIFYLAVSVEIAYRYGWGMGGAILMAFLWPILIPVLALGPARYHPPGMAST